MKVSYCIQHKCEYNPFGICAATSLSTPSFTRINFIIIKLLGTDCCFIRFGDENLRSFPYLSKLNHNPDVTAPVNIFLFDASVVHQLCMAKIMERRYSLLLL